MSDRSSRKLLGLIPGDLDDAAFEAAADALAEAIFDEAGADPLAGTPGARAAVIERARAVAARYLQFHEPFLVRGAEAWLHVSLHESEAAMTDGSPPANEWYERRHGLEREPLSRRRCVEAARDPATGRLRALWIELAVAPTADGRWALRRYVFGPEGDGVREEGVLFGATERADGTLDVRVEDLLSHASPGPVRR